MARVCEKIVECYPGALMHVPNRLKTVKMCERAIEADSWQLYHTPDHFKTQKMCDDVVRRHPYSLIGVLDWCGNSTNKNMAWKWLSRWCGCYQMVRRLSRTEASEITLNNLCMSEEEVIDSCFKNYLIRKSPPIHKIWLLPRPKGMNKYIPAWNYSSMDKRDPW